MRIIILLFYLVSILRCSIILDTKSNTSFKVITPRHLKSSINRWSELTLPIIPGGKTAKEIQDCKKLNLPFSLEGLAVVLFSGNGCSLEEHADLALKKNASAIFFISGSAHSIEACVFSSHRVKNRNTPILMLKYTDFYKLSNAWANSNTTHPVLITVVDDPNEWRKITNKSMIAFQVVIELILIASIVFGIKGQIQFAMAQGISPTAAQICLLFNNLSLLTFIIMVFDYYYIRNWYPFQLTNTLNTLVLCFSNIASISLAYFFQELLRHKMLSFPGLSKFKIAFILTSIALLALYITFSVLSSLYLSTIGMVRASLLIPAIIYLILIVFFILGGVSLIKSLHKYKKMKNLRRISIVVLLSTIGMTSNSILLIVYVPFILKITERGFLAFIILFNLTELLVIIPQIFIFKQPKTFPNESKPTGEPKTSPKKIYSGFNSESK